MIDAQTKRLINFEDSNEDCIFKNNITFIIPEYQRKYSWKEKNIDELLDTLINNENLNELFMGTILYNTIENNVYEIIDGQQRLITFAILIDLLYPDTCKLSWQLKNMPSDTIKDANKEITDYIYTIKDRSDKETIRKNIKKVYFVALQTKDMELPEIINIFNRLNTTGLDLNASDIFKIRYYNYLKTHSNDLNTNWIEKINDCYKDIEEFNLKNELIPIKSFDWILTVFKHILVITNSSLNQYAFLQSNETFFCNFFKDEKCLNESKELLQFDNFKNLIESYKEMHKVLTSPNDNIETNQLIVCFIEETRYSLFWTLPYIAHYFNNDYKQALERSILITKYFIIESVCYDKRIQAVIKSVYDSLKEIAQNNTDLKQLKSEISKEKEKFTNKLKEDISNNRKRCRILCLLIEYLDEIESSKNSEEIFNFLFSKNPKTNFDNEHISPRNPTYGEIPSEVNTLGNLVLLESSINRSIKNNIKSKSEGYQGSKLDSVKKIIPLLSNWNDDEIPKRSITLENKIIDYLFKDTL